MDSFQVDNSVEQERQQRLSGQPYIGPNSQAGHRGQSFLQHSLHTTNPHM